ncbi:guanine deaminase [Pseudooceanicola marinus]|uniref:guanine deaminase n=1 Tax=Pseudooceanicola marinus TaxID=396013 RepID=UPI001CD8184B|nr:guanine deaminase [Pseudooceanicola marinus]MCA1337320.1 guanine deaminase [Pseudooceanicola marinus]
MGEKVLMTGRVMDFTADPFKAPWADCVSYEEHGGLLIEGGQILARGTADALKADHPDARVVDYGKGLILPGFVDAHVHFPQTAMIASWGKRLIDWLNTYTFPEEMKFASLDYAAEIAARYLDLTTAHGTTSMVSFCTIHPESVEAFFAEAGKRGQRVVAGKTCMDRNAPEGLRDTPQTAYDQSKALLEKWHGQGRIGYAITPRFSPTSTPEQLEALGALWAEHPEVLMQTHLSEQTDEIAWVQGLYPEARDYLDTYEAFGLLGSNGLYGHSIHLEPREIARLDEMGAAVVHCPTSNTFIGSGLFDMKGITQTKIRVGLATDTGGGSDFSMLRTMAAAYEVGQLRHNPLHPAQLLWLATAGSAGALGMADRIGTLAPGSEADVVVLDLASTPAIAQREAQAGDIWEAVFPTIMMGDDRAVQAVWIGGRAAF